MPHTNLWQLLLHATHKTRFAPETNVQVQRFAVKDSSPHCTSSTSARLVALRRLWDDPGGESTLLDQPLEAAGAA
jgi:hypothetical protein